MEVTHVGIGFILAFIGFITPAMLNMTTVRTSIEQGKSQGVLFGAGAATINAIHGLLAFTFLRHLDANPDIILWLKRISVVILFTLAFFFYKKSKKVIAAKDKKGNMPAYFEGLIMSSINMLGLPYYFTVALLLESQAYISATAPYMYYMAVGVFLGGTAMLAIYSVAAETIARKSEYVTKNINLILSGVFVILALIVLVILFVG
ncbi:MAG: threonine/homoserine/homoserine lactone efflux protein [Saprospiraceae bacterium]|jgi:threonine/homoserine/homoserine lactone efflux protein